MKMETSPYHTSDCDNLPPELSELSLYAGAQVYHLPKVVEDENYGMEDHQLCSLKPMADYSTGAQELKCYIYKHPDAWNSLEVLAWINDMGQQSEDIDFKMLRAENFNELNGRDLAHMTVEDFKARDPNYGELLYEAFQDLQIKNEYSPSSTYDDSTDYNPTNGSMLALINDDTISAFIMNDHQLFEPDVSPDAPFEIFSHERPHRTSSCSSSSGYGTDGSGGDHIGFTDLYNTSTCFEDDHMPLPPFSTLIKNSSSNTTNNIPSVVTGDAIHNGMYESSPRRNKPGRPRKNFPASCNEEGEPQRTHRGRKQGQTSKGSHLWEFVCDLLRDSQHNPSIIRWESKADGVFRFVKSEQVAKLWGQKKNNKTMTYEKLSRAMRFCRSSGFFADVPKDHNFPKKLCFRFGPKSYGWESL